MKIRYKCIHKGCLCAGSLKNQKTACDVLFFFSKRRVGWTLDSMEYLDYHTRENVRFRFASVIEFFLLLPRKIVHLQTCSGWIMVSI